MNKYSKIVIVSSVLWAASQSLYAATSASKPLMFAGLSEVCVQTQPQYVAMCKRSKAALTQFTKDLSQSISKPVELAVYTNVADATHMLESGQADMAYVKQVPYVELQKKQDGDAFQAIAISVENDGSDSYSSAFFTLKSEKQMSLSDLKDKKIGMIKASASGWYLPVMALKGAGIYNSKNIVVYSTYFSEIQALNDGKVSGVFAADTALSSGVFGEATNYKVNFRLTPKLPTAYFVINRSTVDEATVKKLQAALVSMHVQYDNQSGINPFVGFKLCNNGQCKTLADITPQEVKAVAP